MTNPTIERLLEQEAAIPAGMMKHLRYLLLEAANEIERLNRGDFTEEEFQNLCHNQSEDDKQRFCDGCDEYQRKMFGSSRTDLLSGIIDNWSRKCERHERRIEELTHERDQAIHEANRRDQKWKDGIEHICGCKIDFAPGMSHPVNEVPPPSLDQYISQLKSEVEKFHKFKALVHATLDELGVPKYEDRECRIKPRMIALAEMISFNLKPAFLIDLDKIKGM